MDEEVTSPPGQYLPFVAEPRRKSFGTNSGWDEQAYATGADSTAGMSSAGWDAGTYATGEEPGEPDAAYQDLGEAMAFPGGERAYEEPVVRATDVDVEYASAGDMTKDGYEVPPDILPVANNYAPDTPGHGMPSPDRAPGQPATPAYNVVGLSSLENGGYEAFGAEDEGMYDVAHRGLARQQLRNVQAAEEWDSAAYSTGRDNTGPPNSEWDPNSYATEH